MMRLESSELEISNGIINQSYFNEVQKIPFQNPPMCNELATIHENRAVVVFYQSLERFAYANSVGTYTNSKQR